MSEAWSLDRPWRYVIVAVVSLVAISIFVLFWLCWGSQTTVLLVRHADRQGSADALTPVGAARATDLARALEKSTLTAIYASEAIRTQQTAEPSANQFGIATEIVPAADVEGLVNSIRSHHAGQTILVVGHSNTVPQIIAHFGGPAVTIDESEFDDLFVLTLCCRFDWQSLRVTHLQYGAASP